MSKMPLSSPEETQNSQTGTSLTPMLRQYHEIKAQHNDCVLFFRLGDFYEMFYDDAKTISRALDLVLTARGKGSSRAVPMCGFPHHAADGYIAKLVKSGYKIAICEQLEDPALAKGIVKRDITRIITSGTYLDESDSAARYIAALCPNKTHVGFAFIDASQGVIQVNEILDQEEKLISLLARLPIYECVISETQAQRFQSFFQHPAVKLKNITLSPRADWNFNPEMSHKSLCEHFQVKNLHGFGIEEKTAAISACGALLEYLKEVNQQPLEHIDRITLYSDEEFAFISPAAHRGLELETLIQTLDHTRTAMGRRAFWFWFYHPLKNIEAIRSRQSAVQKLRSETTLLKNLKEYLNRIPDIEKNLSRLSCGYTHAKDLLAIRNTLNLIPKIQSLLTPLCSSTTLLQVEDILPLRQLLAAQVNEDIPLAKPEGKIIAPGVNAELDELRDIQDNANQWLKKFQQEEITRSGINSLKVGFNKVFGYYIEVTNSNLNSVPNEYIRKQTLVNAERFITPQLKEFEEKILTAQEKILKIENILVKEIRNKILTHSKEIHHLCDQIAQIDALYALATLSLSPQYICPQITEERVIDIRDGRHPVVEKTSTETFIANDTLLDSKENQLIILTGPNMSGKSTYIRQTAILTIMAQVGSFIPAKSAQIGIVDKFFTRIGAHDDIAAGQSTFMVEMNEAADILNNLTERSLVILDEIGRGTSTYDGLSLAWAIAEHLISKKARTLFATHFHELTALAQEHQSVKNYNVAVKEWQDEIIFLHKIIPGGTDDSYGIYVAKLAGIRTDVIQRAKKILTQLELKTNIKGHLTGQGTSQQIDFFTPPEIDPVAKEILEDIRSLDVDHLTPLEALNKLNEIKNKTAKNK